MKIKKSFLAVISATLIASSVPAYATSTIIDSAPSQMQTQIQTLINSLVSDVGVDKIAGTHIQTVTGAVVAPTCTVNFPSDIEFDPVSAVEARDAAVGSVLKSQSAEISMHDCKKNTRYSYKLHAFGNKSGRGESQVFKNDGSVFSGLELYVKNSAGQPLHADGSLRGLVTTNNIGSSVVPISVELKKAAGTLDEGEFMGGYVYVITQS
ncbi:hypothetical protein OPC74_004311 [Salmonella enterica]|nr:hypothetical protein [Salmonella enterica]